MSLNDGRQCPIHEFTLVLDDAFELTNQLVNALYEAGCDDATISSSAGLIGVGFDREGPSRSDAIASAIADVEKAKVGQPGLHVDKVIFEEEGVSGPSVWQRAPRSEHVEAVRVSIQANLAAERAAAAEHLQLIRDLWSFADELSDRLDVFKKRLCIAEHRLLQRKG